MRERARELGVLERMREDERMRLREIGVREGAREKEEVSEGGK